MRAVTYRKRPSERRSGRALAPAPAPVEILARSGLRRGLFLSRAVQPKASRALARARRVLFPPLLLLLSFPSACRAFVACALHPLLLLPYLSSLLAAPLRVSDPLRGSRPSTAASLRTILAHEGDRAPARTRTHKGESRAGRKGVRGRGFKRGAVRRAHAVQRCAGRRVSFPLSPCPLPPGGGRGSPLA